MNNMNLHQVNMGGVLSSQTTFFYSEIKIGLFLIALSFLCFNNTT